MPQPELPKGYERMFRNAADALQKKHKADNSVVTHMIDGEPWMMVFCPDSSHYYAVQTDKVSTIESGKSCIRPGYRINPQSGEFECQTLEGDEQEFFTFAVKQYASIDSKDEAAIEVETFQQHQFGESLLTSDDGYPIVISIYFPGEPLTNLEGKTTNLIANLSFAERIDLINQLSTQYYQLHHHHSGGKIHIDVKGPNIIINAGPGVKPRARFIDFGSVRKIGDVSESIDTSISGMTPYAIPPEALQKAVEAQKGSLAMHAVGGSVSTKSDVYGLTAIFGSILGAKEPYKERHCAFSRIPGFIDVAALRDTMDKGFSIQNIFGIPPSLSFYFPAQLTCGFYRVNTLAPIKEVVLRNIQQDRCYIQYNNKLLYKDGGSLYGYDRQLRNTAQKTRDIKETETLSDFDLSRLDTIADYKRQTQGINVQSLLEPKIREFLQAMSNDDPAERPSSAMVREFFSTIHHMCQISESGFFHGQALQPHEKHHALSLALLKLDLILLGAYECGDLVPLKPSENPETILCPIMGLYRSPEAASKFQSLTQFVADLKAFSLQQTEEFPAWPSDIMFEQTQQPAESVYGSGITFLPPPPVLPQTGAVTPGVQLPPQQPA